MAGRGWAVRRARPRGKPQDGELSPERMAFCEGILEGKGHRVAYEESGFKASGKDAATNARQLLKEPEVQAYIAARRIELRERTDITAERVVEEIALAAFVNITEFGQYRIDGPEDLQHLPERLQRVVRGWKWDRHGNFVLQFSDKQRALERLAKHLGLYQAERVDEADRGAMLVATAFWRFVISLHVGKGVAVQEAIRVAETNPQFVEDWGRRGDAASDVTGC